MDAPAPWPRGLEQYHHEWRQPGDKIARQNKELERFQHRRFIPVRLKTLWLTNLARRIEPKTSASQPADSEIEPAILFGAHSFVGLLLRRLLIWVVAASVAFYLPFKTAGLPPSLDALAAWQDQLLAQVKLDDLFAATLAMAILSASDIIDNILAPREGGTDAISAGSGWCLIAAYFVFTLYAAPIYTKFDAAPAWKTLDAAGQETLRTDLHILWVVLGLSLCSEFIIAAASLRRRS